MIVLAPRHSTKLSACSSQQNLIRFAHPLSSESFTKGRRTLLKIVAVATAALEIFGASCIFGWFVRFDDFSVALNFLERTVPLNGYKTTSTLKLKSLVFTLPIQTFWHFEHHYFILEARTHTTANPSVQFSNVYFLLIRMVMCTHTDSAHDTPPVKLHVWEAGNLDFSL